MSSAKADSAIKAYGKVNVQAGAEYATPHRLITMLIDGALEKISAAKGYMQRKEIENKGNYISWAISIIEGLRASLDGEKGGEIAANLEGLYSYMQKRLVEANINNSEEMLDEVSGLLKTIREAWIGIPQDLQTKESIEDIKPG
ncbi:MAG: flagellar export chaperone FliS [Gammaproteobacteria bacterium]|nr:flagellar export chaperone FliS [Gammaproteobacteria bacterium]MDH5694286.1 flagellar export chaperone FliS [Gammaproteobacteria bacterium]